MSSFWGIDFGTTTTYVSNSSRNLDTLVPIGQFGEMYAPSVAGFDGSRLVFCEETSKLDEQFKIRSVKYLITRGGNLHPGLGLTESSDIASGRLLLLPEKNLPGRQAFSSQSSLGRQETTVEEVVGGILGVALSRAEASEGAVSDVRMGCPAMWDASRRRRLIEIARSSGISVTDGTLIDEPIAACINWVEANRHLTIRGKVVIFDMGGGTLDTSVIEVDSNPSMEPKLYVLASNGISEAGNAIDDTIANFIIENRLSPDTRDTPGEVVFGWVKEAARQIKESLGRNSRSKGLLTIPNNPQQALELDRSEIKDCLADQMERAVELVSRTLKSALITKPVLVDSSIEMSYKTIRDMTFTELMKDIDFFVLAGGMARMPLLEEMLIERGVEKQKIVFADDRNPAEAIAKGLGSGVIYQRMALHLPSFSFVLEWADPETGEVNSFEIYAAHSPLVKPYEAAQGQTRFYQRFERAQLPTTGVGVIRGISVDGVQIKFGINGIDADGIRFAFGGQQGVFRFDRSGHIFMRDTAGNVQQLHVSGWPIVRNFRSSKIELTAVSSSWNDSSPWWSNYENMRP